MAVRTVNAGSSYPSVSWSDTLDVQRSALRWDVKRTMKSLCSKLEEIGEECFVVTVNVSNGWVGHLGTLRGDEYIDEKSHILYDFLNYCAESLYADETKERTEDTNSDTESGIGDVTVNGEDDTPITISRPCLDEDRSNTEASDNDDHVIVETPVRYIYRQPKGSVPVVPVETPAEKFILMSPVDIQNVTQRVLETEYQPAGKKTVRPEIQSFDCASQTVLVKENKRKRKQSFEGIDNHGNKELPEGIVQHGSKEPPKGYIKEFMSYWSLTPDARKETDSDMESSATISEEQVIQYRTKLPSGRKYHKNKRYRDEYVDQSIPYVSNNETDTVMFTPGSDLDDSEEVTTSTRILRSSSLQGKKQDRQKAKGKLLSKSSGDEDDEEVDDVDWDEDNDDDDEDYVADDANDEDWDMDFEERELSGRLDRDNLGRFLGSTRKSSRKRKKSGETLSSSSKETEADLDVQSEDSGELIRVNVLHSIGARGKLELDMSSSEAGLLQGKKILEPNFERTVEGTEVLRDNEGITNLENVETLQRSENITTKGRRRVSRKKGKLTATETTVYIDLEDVGSSEQIEEQSTDIIEKCESEKELLRRPSLKRKLKNVADEKWTIVDDSKPKSGTKSSAE